MHFSPQKVVINLALWARNKHGSKFNSEATAVQTVTATLILFLQLQQSLVPVCHNFCLLAPSLASLSASSFPWKPAWPGICIHWISMPFDRLSSFWKSSLFITLPPELVLQPFVFQFSTQLVIPTQREYYHKTCYERTTVSKVKKVFQYINSIQSHRQKHHKK